MPRLRPLKKQEEEPEVVEFSAPPEGDIEIELSGEDGGSTEIETAPEKKPEPKVETEDNPLQKALDAQQRAEELQRTAQRERDEAVRQAREHSDELTRERGERQDAEYNSVLTAIAAETSALEKAESDAATFAAAGDWANSMKAQRIMASAAARLDRLEDGKQAFEAKRKTDPETKAPPQKPQAGFEERIAALPENAKGWLRKHPEFINDSEKNRKIQAAHGAIVDLDGVEAFSTAYFDALDTKLGFKQAEPTQREEPKPKQRSIPMTAPVSRDVPNASGARQASTKITLNEEERDIARRSIVDRPGMTKMSDAEKEYLYAKNKQKYLAMKANGTYSEQTK